MSEEDRLRMEEERKRMKAERDMMVEDRKKMDEDRDVYTQERRKFQEEHILLQGDLTSAIKVSFPDAWLLEESSYDQMIIMF